MTACAAAEQGRVHVIEVDPADDAAFDAGFDAAFDAWLAVLEAARAVDRSGDPGWQRQELTALARRSRQPGAPTRSRTLAAVLDGRGRDGSAPGTRRRTRR